MSELSFEDLAELGIETRSTNVFWLLAKRKLYFDIQQMAFLSSNGVLCCTSSAVRLPTERTPSLGFHNKMKNENNGAILVVFTHRSGRESGRRNLGCGKRSHCPGIRGSI